MTWLGVPPPSEIPQKTISLTTQFTVPVFLDISYQLIFKREIAVLYNCMFENLMIRN